MFTLFGGGVGNANILCLHPYIYQSKSADKGNR